MGKAREANFPPVTIMKLSRRAAQCPYLLGSSVSLTILILLMLIQTTQYFSLWDQLCFFLFVCLFVFCFFFIYIYIYIIAPHSYIPPGSGLGTRRLTSKYHFLKYSIHLVQCYLIVALHPS